MTLLAGVLGAVSGYLGAATSALLPRFPAGAVIVLVAGAFFLVSLLLAPARGVVAAGLRYARLRLRVASQHLLRAVYEADECGRRESGRPVPLEELRALRPFARRGWGWSSAGWRFAGSCAGSTAAAACCSPTPGGARPCG
jgi:manganese/zinc/iron transport system permease protein